MVVVRDDDVAIVIRQRSESRCHGRAHRARFESCAGKLFVALVRSNRGVEVGDVDDTRAQAALRSHEHERFVRGHTKKPRGEARVASKRRQLAQHLDERDLEKIATVFVRERVTEQLSFDVRR